MVFLYPSSHWTQFRLHSHGYSSVQRNTYHFTNLALILIVHSADPNHLSVSQNILASEHNEFANSDDAEANASFEILAEPTLVVGSALESDV